MSRLISTPRVRRVLAVMEDELSRWRVPAVGEIAEDTGDPFQILVSCILSLRTKDAVTDAASTRLFALARTPQAMSALPPEIIERAIYPVGFYRIKTMQILEICRRLQDEHQGRVPRRLDALLRLPGVGRKTANLVLGFGFGQAAICVDTHVHRISNRLGWVETRTPEQTEAALQQVVPRRHWTRLNELMVPYGQNLCQPVSPWCSHCQLAAECPRVGVLRSR